MSRVTLPLLIGNSLNSSRLNREFLCPCSKSTGDSAFLNRSRVRLIGGLFCEDLLLDVHLGVHFGI